MLRYKLRTLLIVLALGPAVLYLGGCGPEYTDDRDRRLDQGIQNVDEHAGKIEAAARQDNSP